MSKPAQKTNWVPWVVLALCTLLFAIMPIFSKKQVAEGEIDFYAFGKLPVMKVEGRLQPMDSVARNALLQIAHQQRISLEGNGPNQEWGDLYELSLKSNGQGLSYQSFGQKFTKRPQKLHPTEWLMEVLMQPDVADKRFIFRIDHPELLSELQLEKQGVNKSGLRFYNFLQLRQHMMLLHKKGQVIRKKKAQERSLYEQAAYRLTQGLHIYIQLRSSLQPNYLDLGRGDDKQFTGVGDFSADLGAMRMAAKEMSQLLAERRKAAVDGEPMPHLLEGFEWTLKEGKHKKGEIPGSTYVRVSPVAQEVELFGRFLNEVIIGETDFHADQLKPDSIEAFSKPLIEKLELLVERNRGEGEVRAKMLAHVAEDFLSLDAEAQQIVLRYLLLVEGRMQVMKENGNLMMIPPAKILADEWEGDPWGWRKVGATALQDLGGTGTVPEPLNIYSKMSTAYNAVGADGKVTGDAQAFNAAVEEYRSWLAENGFTKELKKGREEHYFNTFAPFARAQGIYIIALLLACFSWLKLSRGLADTAFYLIGLAFVLHTMGLIFRMYLEGRPPVTNLYSSAVFVGWGGVMLGWVLERIYRNGIGSSVAALVGFSTLIIAAHLAREEGDTMEMLQAVLDTNFWLATHVVIITIGYSATFLAGFLAIIYVVRGALTPSLEKETAKGLVRMVYGIVCFATLFSFVGTVLGGIWADQSWGRFWGWDSKENGALMIVVWNAIILHCRWGGFVKDRGLINLAIFGNIITAWSWFGVNMLGEGLHSYGFMDSAFMSLRWFGVSQLLLMMVAAQPLINWLSARHMEKVHNRLIGTICAVLMGLGLALHIAAFFFHKEKGGILMYLGIALVSAGLLLSYLPSGITGVNPEKKAA